MHGILRAFCTGIILYMYLFIVITVSLVIGGALGYILSTLHRKSKYNNFFDPEEASSFGEAGRRVANERTEKRNR